MNAPESHPSISLPPSKSTGLIDFETAAVISPMIYPPQPRLVVTGAKPYPGMTVELVPLTYMRQPEYWGIEVIGSSRGLVPVHLPAPMPYTVELDIRGVTGTIGVEVIGASHTEQLPLVPQEGTEFVGTVEGNRFRPLYPDSARALSLRLTTAGVKDDAGAEAGEIDLAPYGRSMLRVLGRHEGDWVHSAVIAEEVPDSILSIVARRVLAAHPT